jgi:hypothetical protein
MLTKDQMLLLGAAAKSGDYVVSRAYNSSWGEDLRGLRDLEALGLMKFLALERDPSTKALVRTSQITDAGRSAWATAHEIYNEMLRQKLDC